MQNDACTTHENERAIAERNCSQASHTFFAKVPVPYLQHHLLRAAAWVVTVNRKAELLVEDRIQSAFVYCGSGLKCANVEFDIRVGRAHEVGVLDELVADGKVQGSLDEDAQSEFFAGC